MKLYGIVEKKNKSKKKGAEVFGTGLKISKINSFAH